MVKILKFSDDNWCRGKEEAEGGERQTQEILKLQVRLRGGGGGLFKFLYFPFKATGSHGQTEVGIGNLVIKVSLYC